MLEMIYKIGDLVQLVLPSSIISGPSEAMSYGIPSSCWYKYAGVRLVIYKMLGDSTIYLKVEATGLQASSYHWLPCHLRYYKSKTIRKVNCWK